MRLLIYPNILTKAKSGFWIVSIVAIFRTQMTGMSEFRKKRKKAVL